ncbi:hypothetical protein FSP39_003376 [Pinctada imbricata]|uniref:mitogen-activated protein kinase n=1 Tax=Pinctada imbricata TaxID=66713 RepID=A0AA88XWV6_PINIB|nr:hypothetical protein FSP39_003376 [Pinctada imbricata]
MIACLKGGSIGIEERHHRHSITSRAAKPDLHVRRKKENAYGIVWKAVDRRTGEVVAVKKIFDAFRNQTDAQRTFREIMFLQEFGDHNNIVKLHNVIKAENDKDIYLVFEFMDTDELRRFDLIFTETDLHNVIKRGSILKDVHKRYIMYQMFKATKYLHSGNVIHRDQKPSNILLDSECVVKVCDFGLARSLTQIGVDAETGDPNLTEYVATRWYRAPEILLGSHRYTKGVDMWSLGCILGEMLGGKPLFPGSSTLNQIEKIMSVIPSPTREDIDSIKSAYGSSVLEKASSKSKKSIEDLLPDAPKDGVDLLRRLIQFNPDKRITADEALRHPFVSRFHNAAEEISLNYDVVPPLSDDVQLTVEEYRNKLYEGNWKTECYLPVAFGRTTYNDPRDARGRQQRQRTYDQLPHGSQSAAAMQDPYPPMPKSRQASAPAANRGSRPGSQYRNNPTITREETKGGLAVTSSRLLGIGRLLKCALDPLPPIPTSYQAYRDAYNDTYHEGYQDVYHDAFTSDEPVPGQRPVSATSAQKQKPIYGRKQFNNAINNPSHGAPKAYFGSYTQNVGTISSSALASIQAASTARVYPAVLGSSVTLECSVRQEDKLVWDRGDGSRVIAVNGAFYPGVNTSSYLLQNTSVGQSLIIHSLSLIDDGTYRCYDLKNATNKQLMNVTILVEPPYVWSTGPNGIIEEGTKQVFICTADGGKPPPNMEWILIDRKANRKSFIGLNTDHRYTNGTYRRTNRLEIITSRDMYRASMICKVSISYFYEVQQTIVLDVNLYPLAPKFTDFTGLFDDGRVHNIECYSTGSRPAGSIYWQIDGNPVSSTADSTTKGADGLFYQSSTLSMRLTKNIQGQMLKCLVTNQVLQNQQKPDLFVQVMLLANFAPSIIADNGSRSVIEDNDVIMTCDVDARPLTVAGQFIWVHNGNPITSNSVYNITNDVLSVSKMTSTLHISPVSKASFGQYYCQASNHLGTQKSKVLTLDVQYRPVCAFQTKERHAGVLGKRLTLNCPVSSNPQNVTMTWRYVTRSSPPIRQNLAGLRMVNGFRYTTIDIDIRSASQFTDIECVATNSLGSSKAPCMYRIVKPGPPEIPHDCKSTATSDTEYVISCTPGFDGGYHQYFILQHLDDGQFHPSANNSDPNFTVQGLSQDKNFTYRVCSATDAFPQVTSCSNAIVISTGESMLSFFFSLSLQNMSLLVCYDFAHYYLI